VDILTDYWSQIEFELGDLTAIKLLGKWGALTVLNIYNDCEHNSTINMLEISQRNLDDNEQGLPHENVHTIWLGDFNRHHPHWDSTSDSRLFTQLFLARHTTAESCKLAQPATKAVSRSLHKSIF